MSYNNNIPQSNDRPSDSQSDLLNNFSALKTYLDRNHVAISNPGAVPDEGKHKFLQMPEQGAAPATLANEGALYTAVGATSAVSELVFRRESNGTSIPFTEHAAALPGYTRLPSGILLKWGRNSIGAGAQVVSINNGPAFTSVFSIQVTVEDGSGTPNTFVTLNSTPSASNTQFTAFASQRTTTSTNAAVLHWLAIGVG